MPPSRSSSKGHLDEDQHKMLWCIDEYLRHWGNFWRECEKGLVKVPA